FEAVDKYTLKLTLDKPNPDLLDSLAVHNVVIVAQERVEQTGGKLDDPPVIGTGPFIFDNWTPNQRFTAKRNPDYFVSGRPYIDAIESYRASDPSLLANRRASTSTCRSGRLSGSISDLIAVGEAKEHALDDGKSLRISRGEIAEFCQRNHIRRLALFGSVLREDFRPESDV